MTLWPRVINSVAPIRICDNGGWTDTWFARHGKILNLAVYPYAEVQVVVSEHDGERPRITINAENYGERYTIDKPRGRGDYDKHPLLEAALDIMRIPANTAVDISIFSEAPVGCSTGTSAAVSVALIGALDRLTPGHMTPHEVARTAHKVETELLGQQCGIQDQLASAYGGINFIDMHDYPHAAVSPIFVPNAVWWELERRLSLIYVGHAHSSSEVHKSVIRELEGAGPDSPKLRPLRKTAEAARDALYNGDFAAFGRSMIDNTDGQANLHADLVGPDHRRIIEAARDHGAIGWKVNGAGGDGGSVTILGGTDSSQKRAMVRSLEQNNPQYKSIPIYLSRFGLRAWEAAAPGHVSDEPR
jgi:D-glycero-alpha-D-manno-heptose-7-phosphate kinase